MKSDVVAMVPVRAGSNRVPNKNTRPFSDTNLLSLKLNVLKRVNNINKIIVSTDCKKSAKIAEEHGIPVQWRDQYYAGSDITNDQHWYHIAKTTPGEIVFLAQVTSPLLRVSSIQDALKTFINLKEHDSINSVSSEKKFFWRDGKPMNYDSTITPKSQDLPDIYSLNFAITIIPKRIMMERKNVVGYQPKFVELDKIEALDIDDILDFKIAEALFNELGVDWLMR